MAANRIGALAVTSAADSTKIIGIVSERDYLTKVALLGKSSKTTPIIQICTHGEANLVTVNEDDSVDSCMKKVRTPVPHYCAFILICTITLSDISEEQSILHFHQTQLHFFIIILRFNTAGSLPRYPPLACPRLHRKDCQHVLSEGSVQMRCCQTFRGIT
jgi:hypothetical protein